MTTLADLETLRGSDTQIEHSDEWWLVVDAGPCPGRLCPQRMAGRTCAGVISLINAADYSWHWWDLHADADQDLVTR